MIRICNCEISIRPGSQLLLLLVFGQFKSIFWTIDCPFNNVFQQKQFQRHLRNCNRFVETITSRKLSLKIIEFLSGEIKFPKSQEMLLKCLLYHIFSHRKDAQGRVSNPEMESLLSHQNHSQRSAFAKAIVIFLFHVFNFDRKYGDI